MILVGELNPLWNVYHVIMKLQLVTQTKKKKPTQRDQKITKANWNFHSDFEVIIKTKWTMFHWNRIRSHSIFSFIFPLWSPFALPLQPFANNVPMHWIHRWNEHSWISWGFFLKLQLCGCIITIRYKIFQTFIFISIQSGKQKWTISRLWHEWNNHNENIPHLWYRYACLLCRCSVNLVQFSVTLQWLRPRRFLLHRFFPAHSLFTFFCSFIWTSTECYEVLIWVWVCSANIRMDLVHHTPYTIAHNIHKMCKAIGIRIIKL